MTNLQISLLAGSSVISSASVSYAFYRVHQKIDSAIAEAVSALHHRLDASFTNVAVGIKSEFKAVNQDAAAIHERVENAKATIQGDIRQTLAYVERHADTLKAHAEDLRNHAKNITDVASATKFALETRTVPPDPNERPPISI